jgi:exodeoxyribonuclease V gamma subunit
MKPAHRLEAWLDLMVLVATDPSRTWRSLVVGRDAGSAIEVIDLVPSAIPDAQATEARRALQVAVDCYRRGMREPLPLFPTLSRQVYEEKASSEAWSGHEGRGDANDRAVAVAFDGLSYDEVMRIEARPDDPPGSGRRVRRYADYLWGAVSRSVVDAEPPTDPDSAAGADRPPDGGHRDGEP